MLRLIFGQMLITWSLVSYAGDIRTPLREVMASFSAETCVRDSARIKSAFEGLTQEDYLREFKIESYADLANELWDLKIKLHQTMRLLYSNSQFTQDCARAMRGAYHSIRQVEDMVEESYLRNRSDIAFPASAFIKGNPHVHKGPEFKAINLSNELKSGDVILSRGNAFTSAAIASLGEFDTQFSHVSLVYKDKNEKFWTIESHIEIGSIVRPLESHIKDNNFRTMILRFDDAEIAAKAAEYAFQKVKKASETIGNINYDFGFDMDESKNLFCSEVVSWSFEKASEGVIKIPLVRNRIQLRKPTFVQSLGITAEESFIPADLEIDPRFKIIAEWRDANRINDSHEKDAILQAMYSWVDDYGYRMINGSSGKSKFYRNIVWVMRRTPILKTYVDDKLPLNMSRELIGYFGVLESIGELLHKELKAANSSAIKQKNLPLLPQEKFEILENYRLKDEQKFRGKLHRMFRPLNLKDQI
jgi:hypothetical protein